MFSKILIANRGEIACRVIKSARRLGIATVAVHSDADARAPHITLADEAIAIGPAAASQSYLDIARIVEACHASGAEAVHPGYGFLSERAAFVGALEQAGIAFIGPPAEAIELMGDKIASKRFAASVGVSTVPGYDGEIEDSDTAVRVAREVGFPVMIKASAGGGGKGMRVAQTEDEVAEGFERARSESAASFGDDRVFIERFVTRPRHIEIQVLADRHGNCVHLLERECSVQRRNQKVLEEAPSVFLDQATRAEMGRQAVALAKAVDYVGAGTVEFIVNEAREFFFLEMNTRLQVEHPVTELVTGVDIVEQMIRAAAGEPLTIEQADVVANGWAIEARVYAEDASRGFLPSVGRLQRYTPPKEGKTATGAVVRVDDGVREGSEITVHYDPMIAKLCTWGASRDEANDAMRWALDEFVIEGVTTNIDFLSRLVAEDAWRAGDLTTAFIDEHFPEGVVAAEPDATDLRTAFCIAIDAELSASHREAAPLATADMPFDLTLLGASGSTEVRVLSIDETGVIVELDGRRSEIVRERVAPGWVGTIDGRRVTARVGRSAGAVTISRRGSEVTVRVLTPRVAELLPIMPVRDVADISNELRSPMPGTLVSLSVGEGDAVTAGAPLAVVEAMKMENVLRAERDVTVEAVEVTVGEALAVDQTIMRFASD